MSAKKYYGNISTHPLQLQGLLLINHVFNYARKQETRISLKIRYICTKNDVFLAFTFKRMQVKNGKRGKPNTLKKVIFICWSLAKVIKTIKTLAPPLYFLYFPLRIALFCVLNSQFMFSSIFCLHPCLKLWKSLPRTREAWNKSLLFNIFPNYVVEWKGG